MVEGPWGPPDEELLPPPVEVDPCAALVEVDPGVVTPLAVDDVVELVEVELAPGAAVAEVEVCVSPAGVEPGAVVEEVECADPPPCSTRTVSVTITVLPALIVEPEPLEPPWLCAPPAP